MPIIRRDFGKHDDILIAAFGTGDIMFTPARMQDEEKSAMLLFHNSTPHKIGEETQSEIGKTTDEMDRPEFILHFTNPHSINALIHSLIELQQEMFTR